MGSHFAAEFGLVEGQLLDDADDVAGRPVEA